MITMKRTVSFISFLLAFIMQSCSAGPVGIYDSDWCTVQGLVTDMEGNPIEKIRITIELNNGGSPLTSYTSSDGRFICDMPYSATEENTVLKIILDDIDGEENGGLFASRNDQITIIEDENTSSPIVIDLPVYRLSRATASENIPQS